MVFLTAVVATSTAIYTYYARKQFAVMNDQLSEMRSTSQQTDQLIHLYQRQVAELYQQTSNTHELAVQAKNQADRMTELAFQTSAQASATNTLANQTRRYADIASQTLEANRESSKEDRRAWVTAEIGEKEGKFFVAMHNTGKTPAVNGTYVTAFTPGESAVVPEVDFTVNSSTGIDTKNLPPEFVERMKQQGLIPSHPPTGFVIAPGKMEIASYFGTQLAQFISFPQNSRMFIQGRFAYDDIFGRNHETRFCYWYAAPGEFPLCSDHNYMN
jgi:hypothetical protein